MTTAYITPLQLTSMLTIGKCVSTDDTTIAIAVLRVEVDGDKIVTTATDRYRVGRLTLPLLGDHTNTDGTFYLHPTLIDQVVKACGKDAKDQAVVKVHAPLDNEGPTTIELIHTGTNFMAEPYRMNFPAVDRLIDDKPERNDDIPNGIALKPAFLATLKDLRLPGETPKVAGEAAWKLTTKRTESGKPGPVMFTRDNGGRGAIPTQTLEYFLQPNLLLS